MHNTAALTDQKRTLIFINIVITCVATSMLATALTTALPAVIADLNISVTTGQWLTSGYSLAMGIVSPFAGRICGKLGIKLLFTGGSLCMLLSNLSLFFITTKKPGKQEFPASPALIRISEDII